METCMRCGGHHETAGWECYRDQAQRINKEAMRLKDALEAITECENDPGVVAAFIAEEALKHCEL